MTAGELTQRWRALLAKIEERFQLLMAQGQSGCAMLLDLNNLDPIPMSNAWTALEVQVRELIQKVDTTWNEKLEPGLSSDGVEPGEIEQERQRGAALVHRMARAAEKTQIEIFAEAARRLFARAKELLAQEYRCTQCQAALVVSDQFFRSVHLTCSYCRRVNTFNPGIEIRAAEEFCCHHLSRQATAELWWAWLDAEAAMKAARDEDPVLTVLTAAAERALVAYTRAYLEQRIAIVPEHRASFEQDLAGRTAFFHRERERAAKGR